MGVQCTPWLYILGTPRWPYRRFLVVGGHTRWLILRGIIIGFSDQPLPSAPTLRLSSSHCLHLSRLFAKFQDCCAWFVREDYFAFTLSLCFVQRFLCFHVVVPAIATEVVNFVQRGWRICGFCVVILFFGFRNSTVLLMQSTVDWIRGSLRIRFAFIPSDFPLHLWIPRLSESLCFSFHVFAIPSCPMWLMWTQIFSYGMCYFCWFMLLCGVFSDSIRLFLFHVLGRWDRGRSNHCREFFHSTLGFPSAIP